MEPKIGDRMKVSPQLTDQADWIDGEVIDVEHNPFTGLVISIKDKLGRIFFGQSRFFVAIWSFHMFAIAFDMDIKELRNSYGEPYNNAYYEIKKVENWSDLTQIVKEDD